MTEEKFLNDVGQFVKDGYSYADISMIYDLEFDRSTIRRFFVNKKCSKKAMKIIDKFTDIYNIDSLESIKNNGRNWRHTV